MDGVDKRCTDGASSIPGVDNNLDEIVEAIFGKAPLAPGAAQIGIDFSGESGANDERDIFEVLCMIFTKGMAYKYGDISLACAGNPRGAMKRVNIAQITEQQFAEICEYFRSFNIQVNLSIKEIMGLPPGAAFPSSIVVTQPDKLEGYSLRVFNGGKFYFVSFSYVIPNVDTYIPQQQSYQR